jgi:hypothetical protein
MAAPAAGKPPRTIPAGAFFCPTNDTGVCHTACFEDPDGNQLMLHRRYAPYAG